MVSARSELPALGVSLQPSAALGEGSEGLMQWRVQAALRGGGSEQICAVGLGKGC